MKTIYSPLLFVFPILAFSQWSTTPYTKDALFACPGFYSDIVSYPNGSSIIIGIGDNNEIWMQKLDPYGFKQWLPYVTLFPPISGLRVFLPDDDGGIYAIVGTQAQRVDKNGNLRWGVGGKMIIPSGNITTAITDGKNGFIALYNWFDGSQQRVNVLRYDSTGRKLWVAMIDSSNVQNSLSASIVGRLGEKSLTFSSKAKDKFVDLNGVISDADSTFLRSDIFVQETDTTSFNVQLLSFVTDSLGHLTKVRIVKLVKDWDTLWTTSFEARDDNNVEYLNVDYPYLPDGTGNIFHYGSYYDNGDTAYTFVKRISRNGFIGGERGMLIKGLAGRYFFNSKGKIGFLTDYMYAQSVDTSFLSQWGNSFAVISDPFDAYVKHIESDNNGGAIISFWTVAGGIKVQHTGRTGKVGILTKVAENKINPTTFELYQNYPNPFNASTTIVFSLSENSEVELIIFDVLGREIKTVLAENVARGKYSILVEMSSVSSGTYFYRLKNQKNVLIRKMILLR